MKPNLKPGTSALRTVARPIVQTTGWLCKLPLVILGVLLAFSAFLYEMAESLVITLDKCADRLAGKEGE